MRRVLALYAFDEELRRVHHDPARFLGYERKISTEMPVPRNSASNRKLRGISCTGNPPATRSPGGHNLSHWSMVYLNFTDFREAKGSGDWLPLRPLDDLSRLDLFAAPKVIDSGVHE